MGKNTLTEKIEKINKILPKMAKANLIDISHIDSKEDYDIIFPKLKQIKSELQDSMTFNALTDNKKIWNDSNTDIIKQELIERANNNRLSFFSIVPDTAFTVSDYGIQYEKALNEYIEKYNKAPTEKLYLVLQTKEYPMVDDYTLPSNNTIELNDGYSNDIPVKRYMINEKTFNEYLDVLIPSDQSYPKDYGSCDREIALKYSISRSCEILADFINRTGYSFEQIKNSNVTLPEMMISNRINDTPVNDRIHDKITEFKTDQLYDNGLEDFNVNYCGKDFDVFNKILEYPDVNIDIHKHNFYSENIYDEYPTVNSSFETVMTEEIVGERLITTGLNSLSISKNNENYIFEVTDYDENGIIKSEKKVFDNYKDAKNYFNEYKKNNNLFRANTKITISNEVKKSLYDYYQQNIYDKELEESLKSLGIKHTMKCSYADVLYATIDKNYTSNLIKDYHNEARMRIKEALYHITYAKQSPIPDISSLIDKNMMLDIISEQVESGKSVRLSTKNDCAKFSKTNVIFYGKTIAEISNEENIRDFIERNYNTLTQNDKVSVLQAEVINYEIPKKFTNFLIENGYIEDVKSDTKHLQDKDCFNAIAIMKTNDLNSKLANITLASVCDNSLFNYGEICAKAVLDKINTKLEFSHQFYDDKRILEDNLITEITNEIQSGQLNCKDVVYTSNTREITENLFNSKAVANYEESIMKLAEANIVPSLYIASKEHRDLKSIQEFTKEYLKNHDLTKKLSEELIKLPDYRLYGTSKDFVQSLDMLGDYLENSPLTKEREKIVQDIMVEKGYLKEDAQYVADGNTFITPIGKFEFMSENKYMLDTTRINASISERAEELSDKLNNKVSSSQFIDAVVNKEIKVAELENWHEETEIFKNDINFIHFIENKQKENNSIETRKKDAIITLD